MKNISLKKNFIICIIVFITLFVISTILIHHICLPYSTHQQAELIERNEVSYFEILITNIVVCTLAVSGLIFFKVPSWIILIINPIFLGFVLGANWADTGEISYFLRFVIPHSFLEIPAITFSCALGMTGKKGRKSIPVKKILLYFLCVLIVLIISAFIETYISANM